MSDDEKFSKALDYAYLLLKYRPRSVKEMEDGLRRKGYKSGTTKEVIDLLKDQHHLNDFEFAKLWVLDRMSTRPKGKKLIYYELRNKGIDRAIAEEVLSKIKTTYDEREVAGKLAQSRVRQYRKLDPPSLKRRLYQYLQRRGFSYEVIRQVMKEIV